MGLKDDTWRLDPAAYYKRFELQTRYGDMDANKHLNNIAIARLFEESRSRFHYDVRGNVQDEHSRVMIAHVAIDYLAEGFYPDPVTVGIGVSHIGNSSYHMAMGMFQNGQPIALAHAVNVNGRQDGQGTAPLPDVLRGKLEAALVNKG